MIFKKFLLILYCCLLLPSCTVYQKVVTVVNEPSKEEPDVDLSCSYFYFLWGSHAEFAARYAEAFEAYEKALICDPTARYLRDKIPILLLKMGEYEKAAIWLRQALIDRPEETNSMLFLASLYIQQDKLEEAIKLYYQVLERDSDNENVHLRLGLLYSHQEKYDKAEKIFRQLLKKNGSSYFARLSLARLLKETDKADEAAIEYEKALEINWSKELAYEIGNFFSNLKKHADALRLYTSISESDPFDERAGLSRVQAFLDLGNNDEALEELKNISMFSKNQANIELIISKVLLRKNEVQKAQDILERLASETTNSEPRYMLALLAFKEENYPSALAHLNLILPGSADFEDAVYLQIRIFKASGEKDKGVALLRKHIAKEASRRPLFYALLAALYHEKKEDLAAIALLEAAVSIYPDNPQLFFDYGLMLDKNSMEEQAINKMMKVLELQPDHAEALNFVGYTWADKNIRLKEALEYIEKAIALKPDNGYIVDSLGWVFYRLGDYQRAVKELNRSLELEPNDPHIHDHLGDAYRALGKNTEALEQYRKALIMFEDEKKKAAVQGKIDVLDKQQ
ncbi:MAG: tetratricopeptide repeat protein [Proteobacteria bacterium]|nr:tetratricopeptide repeat protein [Pseudomonadota bacterium]